MDPSEVESDASADWEPGSNDEKDYKVLP